MRIPQVTDAPVTQSLFSPPLSPNLFNPAFPALNFASEKDVDPSVLTLKNNANILTTGFTGQKVAACALPPALIAAIAQLTALETGSAIAGTLVTEAQAPLIPLSAAQLTQILPACTGNDIRIPAIRAAGALTGPFPLWGAGANDINDDDYTGDQTHRFFQDWQQEDCSDAHATRDNPSGCRMDLFPFITSGSTLGFLNVERGEVPLLKSLADRFTLSDNFHQSVHGGTYSNHVMLGTGDAIFWNDGNGNPTSPPSNDIANPDPLPGTVNTYTIDGHFTSRTVGGTPQPGGKEVLQYLASLHYHPKPNCEDSHYYMVNNIEPAYLPDGTQTAAAHNPPSLVRTIGDELTDKNITWACYRGAWNDYKFLIQAAKQLGVNPTSLEDLIPVFLNGGSDILTTPSARPIAGAAIPSSTRKVDHGEPGGGRDPSQGHHRPGRGDRRRQPAGGVVRQARRPPRRPPGELQDRPVRGLREPPPRGARRQPGAARGDRAVRHLGRGRRLLGFGLRAAARLLRRRAADPAPDPVGLLDRG